jgi:putative transposase
MPWGLTRFHHSGQNHFVTFCCYHRRRLLTTDENRRIFEPALERVRRSYRLYVYGYVVMPEPVHLLLGEPQRDTLADALKSLKQGVSRRLIGDTEHFCQKRYYDFNIRTYPQFMEKLRYIHRNPVKPGLFDRPDDWQWSSFRHYATGGEGRVVIESEWTARKRERAAGTLCSAVELPPLKPKSGLSGPPRPHRDVVDERAGRSCEAGHKPARGYLRHLVGPIFSKKVVERHGLSTSTIP